MSVYCLTALLRPAAKRNRKIAASTEASNRKMGVRAILEEEDDGEELDDELAGPVLSVLETTVEVAVDVALPVELAPL